MEYGLGAAEACLSKTALEDLVHRLGPAAGDLRRTVVWVKQDGSWKIVAIR